MKLIIQIPCFNEEDFLAKTLADLPRELPGISSIEVLVIDDGSSDRTQEVARNSGVKYVHRIKAHRGLAEAFVKGIEKSLEAGADIIVNLDADNQYKASGIAKLIEPILSGRADIVLGARDFDQISDFSELKRKFQRWGSWVVSLLCNVKFPDVTTGFRAYSRESAFKIVVFTRYTYTLETLVHAAQNGEKIVSVPILTNLSVRKSRLFSHPIQYVLLSAAALIRLVLLYNPLRTMGWVSLFCILIGLGFLNHSPFAGLGWIFLAALSFSLGLILDQIAINRRLLEQLRIQALITRFNK